MLAVGECDPSQTHQYGIVGVGAELGGVVVPHQRDGREAEARGCASNLYINGRYILQPQIFDLLSKQEKGAGNEIQLTDRHAAPDGPPALLWLPLPGRDL